MFETTFPFVVRIPPLGLEELGVKKIMEETVKNCTLSEVARTRHPPQALHNPSATSLGSLGFCNNF